MRALPTVPTVALAALLAATAPPIVAQNAVPHNPAVLFCRRPQSAFPRPPTTSVADEEEQAGGPEPEPALPPGPAPTWHDAGCHCDTHKDVMFSSPGSQTGGIRLKTSKTPEDCCNLCRNDPTNNCTHYTWTPTGKHKPDEWAAALASGKTPNNCLLFPHGGGMPLIKHHTPHQNRTSGFLKPTTAAAPQMDRHEALLILSISLLCWGCWPTLRQKCGAPIAAFAALNIGSQFTTAWVYFFILSTPHSRHQMVKIQPNWPKSA